MSWKSKRPSKEEFSLQYIGNRKVRDILSEKDIARCYERRNLKPIPRVWTFKTVRLYTNGIFTVAILDDDRTETGGLSVGCTKKSDRDLLRMEVGIKIATMRAIRNYL